MVTLVVTFVKTSWNFWWKHWQIHLQTIFSFSVPVFKMSLMLCVFLSQPMNQWDKSFASHSITWAFGTKSHQSFISSKLSSLFWAGIPFSHSAFYRDLPPQYQALLAFTSVDWNSLTARCLAGRIDESITFATRKSAPLINGEGTFGMFGYKQAIDDRVKLYKKKKTKSKMWKTQTLIPSRPLLRRLFITTFQICKKQAAENSTVIPFSQVPPGIMGFKI